MKWNKSNKPQQLLCLSDDELILLHDKKITRSIVSGCSTFDWSPSKELVALAVGNSLRLVGAASPTTIVHQISALLPHKQAGMKSNHAYVPPLQSSYFYLLSSLIILLTSSFVSFHIFYLKVVHHLNWLEEDTVCLGYDVVPSSGPSCFAVLTLDWLQGVAVRVFDFSETLCPRGLGDADGSAPRYHTAYISLWCVEFSSVHISPFMNLSCVLVRARCVAHIYRSVAGSRLL